MPMSVAKKALIGGISSIALGGTLYGTYSFLNSSENIKNTLIKKHKTPLDLNSTKEEDIDFLKELAKQYFSKKPTEKTVIEGLELQNANDTESLKNKCLELFQTNNKDKDFEQKLTQAEEWCIKEKAPRRISTFLPKGKKLLVKENAEKWNEPWGRFKNDYKTENPTAPWDIETWASIKNNSGVEEVFKQKCIDNGSISIMPNTELDLLEKLIKYCTKTDG